jgi:hypothetical protein
MNICILLFLNKGGILIKQSGMMLILLAALGVAIAGCGGGADASGGSEDGVVIVPAGSLSKAEFVKRVNAFCLREQTKLYDETVERLKRNTRPGARPSASLYKETLNTLFIPRTEEQIEQIQAIGAPKGDEKAVGKILTSLQQALEAGRELPEKETIRMEKLLVPGGKLAKRYGIGNCAFP